MKYFSLLLLITISFLPIKRLELEVGFPIWLKDGEIYTDQTSGITFIEEKNGVKVFLICDDVGKIHRIKLKGNQIKIETLNFSDIVEKFFSSFSKIDFEEIVYDHHSKQIYISIEGHGPNQKEDVGIYKLKFQDDNIHSNYIVDVSKIHFPEWEVISRYTDQNIGFEGLGISEGKIFLGLEGFQFSQIFLDSTMLYVVDKKSKKLIREISTKELGIHTICGLYAINDYHILGIDRNQQYFFEIKFHKDYQIKSHYIEKLDLPVPSRKDLKYVAAIESIVLDNDNYIYVIDDPIKKFYVPKNEILSQLKEEDRENFKKFIPLLFKYKLK